MTHLPITEKMERYCQLAACNSYAYAYREAYNCDKYAAISGQIWALNKDPRIAARIRQIQAEAAKPLDVTREWLVAWWYNRATYDPAEITAWAVGACHFCHGEGHQYQWRLPEYLEALRIAEQDGTPLPDFGGGLGYDSRKAPHDDCPSCDGKGVGRTNFADTSSLSPAARAAFDGIEQTKDGIKLKMADKSDAAKEFGKITGFSVPTVKIITEPIPDAEDLAALAGNPEAIATAYKRFMGTAH